MMTFVLVDKRNNILARSPTRTFLEQKAKTYRIKTRIIDEQRNNILLRMAKARRAKEIRRNLQYQRAWTARAAKALGKGKLPSSFVDYLDYDKETEKVHVILSGRKYTFFNVPITRFNAWWKGAATCDTKDPTGLMRWWPDKTPSLGAFFNDKIKPKFTYVRGWI